MTRRVRGELSGRRRLSTDWGRSLEGRRTCKEPSGWSHCPAAPLHTPTTVKVSIVITIGRWRLFLMELCLKSFFAIYQHENGEVTCILSMSSELSQKIVDSFTFLISFNCNHNRLSGKVSLGNIWNLLYGERGRPAWAFVPISVSKPDGKVPKYLIFTALQPNIYSSDTNVIAVLNLKLWNCLPMMQAKVGPTMEPGRGSSLTPAVHRSMSSGLSYISE